MQKAEVFKNKNYVAYTDTYDIVKDVSQLEEPYSTFYAKYINYIAPNAKPIRLIAADNVTDEQLLKAYNVLRFYLTDTDVYKKKAIANSMADRGAVLVLVNGADGDGNIPEEALIGQPLYQMELPTAGSTWYQENDYNHRDASYEEIFHLLHDLGIGTTQHPAAAPELSEKIKEGLESVLPEDKADWGVKGLWGREAKEWLLELEEEGSLEQEYIVSGIDSYYGLWEAYTENDRGMWGTYIPKTRKDVKEQDPQAYRIIHGFLGPVLTYMERISPEFNGTFKIYRDPSEPYTYKSQYLQNVRLTGDKNSSLEGNNLNNVLIGNKGNNALIGRGGEDVVQFSGASSDYSIKKNDGTIVVKDTKNRDGEDTLIDIEILRFTDRDLFVEEVNE